MTEDNGAFFAVAEALPVVKAFAILNRVYVISNQTRIMKLAQ
ncbi:hypothetical protein ACE1TH_09640 [Shouchella sp. JSM 1781072]|nr:MULTISPECIES: hypothetical protein [Bacillaceae]